MARLGWANRKPHLAVPAVFAGAVLPDLIDKPIYYISHDGLKIHGAFADVYAGTRGVAHTFIFLGVLALVAATSKNRIWIGIAIGVATHLSLDIINDLIFSHSTDLRIFLWPALGWNFPSATFPTLGAHLHFVFEPISLITELTGVILLWRRFGRKDSGTFV